MAGFWNYTVPLRQGLTHNIHSEDISKQHFNADTTGGVCALKQATRGSAGSQLVAVETNKAPRPIVMTNAPELSELSRYCRH